MKEPKAIIEDGKIVNHDQLVRYWRDRNLVRDRMRRATFRDIRDNTPEPTPPQEKIVVHRHSDLSKQEHDMLQQATLRVQYLEKQLKEHLKPKKKPEIKTTPRVYTVTDK